MSVPGRSADLLPKCDVPETDIECLVSEEFLRQDEIDLPEVGELDVIRHFTHLSQKNYGVDSGFYPLGSCTMKYNPKINEEVSKYHGFTKVHPYLEETVQGCLEILISRCTTF